MTAVENLFQICPISDNAWTQTGFPWAFRLSEEDGETPRW